MFLTTVFAATLLAQVQSGEPQTVTQLPIHKVAATYLLTRLTLGSPQEPGKPIRCRLIPDLELSSDSRTNSLVAKGPRSKAAELERIVEMFDVDPMRVQVRLKYEVPQFELKGEGAVALSTNTEMQYAEPSSDFQVKVQPRINTDGTVTLTLEVTRAGLRTSMVARIKSGTSIGWTGDHNGLFDFDREPTDKEWGDRGFARVPDPRILRDKNSPTGFRIWCTAAIIPRTKQ